MADELLIYRLRTRKKETLNSLFKLSRANIYGTAWVKRVYVSRVLSRRMKVNSVAITYMVVYSRHAQIGVNMQHDVLRAMFAASEKICNMCSTGGLRNGIFIEILVEIACFIGNHENYNINLAFVNNLPGDPRNCHASEYFQIVRLPGVHA